ncbi:MAG TPA: hypothetical protein VKE74_28490 [Gemmataceae bacterium]|nr:hypothetical protein [Gemmataceae bacterium]
MNIQSLPLLRTGLAVRPSLRLALDVALAAGLFWATSAAYRTASGHHQMADSAYALTVSEKLLTERTVNLSECVPANPAARRAMYCYSPGQDLPYQLVRGTDLRNPGAIYYGYPLGSSILSMPFVRHYAHNRGMTILGPSGVPNEAIEAELQVRIASRVSAAIVVLFYMLARFFCPPLAAALIAAGFGFGSPVFSTLARALWSHTWAVFWLSVAVVFLVGARRVRTPTWRTDLALGVGLGTTIFWAGFCRQHAAISAAAIGVYLLFHNRRLFLFTVLAAVLWSAGLVVISRFYFGSNLPPTVYTAGTIDGKDMLNRFAWLMVSPSRGLLVFCPYLLVLGAILAGCRKRLADAGLLLPAALAVVTHTAVFAAYNGWHGGSSYGPRYFCDVLPWFALAAVIGVGGLLKVTETGFPWRKAAAIAALAVCFGWGVFVHARGANSVPAWFWNHRPAAVGHEAAVKEWDHPQFLAGITFEVEKDGSVRELK